jgi:opacity protein-like surface antigen
MKFKLLAGVALAVTTLAASGATAQDSGFYGALDVGYHWSDNTNFETGLGTASLDGDDDWIGLARLGYRLSPHWRVELEGGWRPGELQPPTVDATGDWEVLSLMGNVIVDFMPDGDLHPFLGVGAGMARGQLGAIAVPFEWVSVTSTPRARAWRTRALPLRRFCNRRAPGRPSLTSRCTTWRAATEAMWWRRWAS